MNGQKLPKFLKSEEASKYFGVSQNTIRRWGDQNLINVIRTDTSSGSGYGHRRYDVSSYKKNTENISTNAKEENVTGEIPKTNQNLSSTVCYCRVSSVKQKDDLKRQTEFMQEKYPTYEVITDIGSGINFKRAGLLKLIKRAISGNLKTVVVAHKDRLARFGFELIEWLLNEYNVELVVLDKENFKTPESELAEDLVSIIHVFSCRINGRRKYKTESSGSTSDNKENANIGSDTEYPTNIEQGTDIESDTKSPSNREDEQIQTTKKIRTGKTPRSENKKTIVRSN